jgi:virginiamycin B lyase
MTDLYEVLERKRTEVRPEPDAFDRLVRFRHRRRRRQQVAAMATALVLLGGVIWASASLLNLRTSPPEPASPIDPAETRVVRTFDLAPGLVTGVATSNGSVWIGNNALPGVVRLDAQTGRTLATARTYTDTSPATIDRHPFISDVVAAFGSIWTLDPEFGTVTRIDPETNRIIARVRVGGNPSDAAEANGSLWVLSAVNGTLSRIDPFTNRVTATRRFAVKDENADIAGDAVEVWVAAGGEVTVINAESLAQVARIEVGSGDNSVALGSAAWVVDQRSGVLSKIDRSRYRVVRTIRVGNAPGSMTLSNEVVWVADARDPILTAIDPVSDRVVLTRRIGRGAVQMTASGSSLVVLNQVDNTLTLLHVEPRRVN